VAAVTGVVDVSGAAGGVVGHYVDGRQVDILERLKLRRFACER
jgi:hypothetical protein